MLDNEPNNHTQAADQAATDQNQAPTGQAATAVAGSETPAPAKKTTRKRTTKKAAAPAPELVTSDSPVTDGPVAAVDTPDQPQNETPAVTPQPRTRRRGPATAAVLFQAPIEV